ncbi:MAG: hypothetical protein HDT13_00555 [Butyrivibrio sp.]|nr:hypothetical protein [Butyrivibrio sp.]
MKVFRKIVIMLLSLCLLMISSGCESLNIRNNSSDDYSYDYEYISDNMNLNEIIPIFNAKNQEIGSITCYGYSALVNGSILYTKYPENTSSSNCLEYWLYDIEAKEDYKLGIVDVDSYEAFYETIKSDNHLYLSVSNGGFAAQDGKQTFYDIDLLQHSMTPILVIERGSPYNSYTIANNKLVVAEFLYNGTTDIVEVDLREKRTSPVIHKYNENDYFTKNSIRHIYADKDYVYTVRLVNDGFDNYSLKLDIYEFNFNLVDTIDISEFCVSTETGRSEDRKINEWKQFISYFFVHNDLVYYQNFSITNAIGTINNSEVDRLINTDALFSYAMSVSNNDENELFIQSYGDNTEYRNIFYLVDPKTHEVKTSVFFADEPLYSFRAAFRDNEKILLTMGYLPYDKGERLPDRLYYIDMNDLDFKPMD